MAAAKLPNAPDESVAPSAPIKGFGAPAVRAKRLDVIPAANAAEVAIEQLRYLADHARNCCAIGCPDCMRLLGAVAVLNKVFG